MACQVYHDFIIMFDYCVFLPEMKHFLFSAEEMKMLDWSCLMRVSHDKMIMIQRNPSSCFLPPNSDCLSLWSSPVICGRSKDPEVLPEWTHISPVAAQQCSAGFNGLFSC